MIPFALSFLQKNTARHTCSSSNRLLSYLVTASEEYEEEEYEQLAQMKTEDFEARSFVLGTCSLAFKVSLQRECSMFNPT